MKILLFGEYSGLHSFLKKGLEELGHHVTLLSFGDDFKKIEGTININIKSKNQTINKMEKVFKLVLFLFKAKNYDVVQLIHPIPLFVNLSSIWYLKVLKKNNGGVFLTSCGADPITVSNQIKNSYSPLQNELKEGIYDKLYAQLGYKKYIRSIKIVENFDGIIGNQLAYHNSYKDFDKYISFIPMPIPKDKIPATVKPVKRYKTKIFHGITRSAFKGSNYIIEAMNRVQDEYPDLCEILIVEKIPLKEYILLFDDCHIFIDQACSYGYGMNALLALAKGKIVLSGAEDEMINQLNLLNCPIINIIPDTQQIYETLVKLIHQKDEFYNMAARKAVHFIQTHHDAKIIGEKYLQAWKKH